VGGEKRWLGAPLWNTVKERKKVPGWVLDGWRVEGSRGKIREYIYSDTVLEI
jgi:hypothetical protein